MTSWKLLSLSVLLSFCLPGLTGAPWEDWTLVCFLLLEEKYLAKPDLSLLIFSAFFHAERLSQLLQSRCVVQGWVVGLGSWMDMSPCWVQGYSRKPLNAEALQ